jgi:hypothetical protein
LDSHIVCDHIDPSWEDEPVLDMYGHTRTPSPDGEFPSSATNSPPNSDQRFSKIENKLALIFEDAENIDSHLRTIQKHTQCAIEGGKQAIQDLALARSTIRKMQSHKIPIKKSKRIIKGASKSPLSSIAGNSRVVRRCTKESMMDIQKESGDARIRDYWHRANQALKEKEEAQGGRDYIDVNDPLFKFVDIDGLVGEK